MAATEPNWRRPDSLRLPNGQLIGPGCVRSPGTDVSPKQSGAPPDAPPPRAPRRPFDGQRLIGSIRRECLDHIVVLGEQHLRVNFVATRGGAPPGRTP